MKILLRELRQIIREELTRDQHLSNIALHFHGNGRLSAADVEFIKSDPEFVSLSSGRVYRGLVNAAGRDFTDGRRAGVYEESGVFKNMHPAESWTTDIKIAKEFGASNVSETPGVILYADAVDNPGVFYDTETFVSHPDFSEDIGELEESEVLAFGPVKYYAIEVVRPADSGDPLEAILKWGRKYGYESIMPGAYLFDLTSPTGKYYRDEKGEKLTKKGYYEYLVDANNFPFVTWSNKDLKAGKVMYRDGDKWVKKKISDLP